MMLRTTTCQYQKDLIVVVKMSLNDSQSPKRKPLEKNLSKWVETWWGKTSRRVEASDNKLGHSLEPSCASDGENVGGGVRLV